MQFRLGRLEGSKVQTDFAGFSVIRDHIFRFVRKNSLKLNMYTNVETEDGWTLQVSTVALLNKDTNTVIGQKVRKVMESILAEASKKETLDQLIKAVISGGLQKSMRMAGTKIYPVRFCEIERMEVLGEPAAGKTTVKEPKGAEETAAAGAAALEETKEAEPELEEVQAG